MSQTVKVQRVLVVSGSSEYTLSVSQLATPTHVEPSGSITRASDGTLWRSLDGGNWTGIGAGSGTPDGSTLSSVTGVLNALPLSGTVNARFANISGTVDGHFNALSGTIDARFTNLSGTVDGHFNALSGTINSAIVSLSGTTNSAIVALSGTVNARFKAIWPAGDVIDLSGSIASAIAHAGGGGGTTTVVGGLQRIVYTANGAEGSAFTVPLTTPLTDTSYSVFMENASTGTFGYTTPSSLRTTSSFGVILTNDTVNGQELDFLVVPSNVVTNAGALMTNVQRWSYFATGSEGSYFTVNLPSVQNDTLYTVFGTNASTSSFVMNIPSGSRTTTSFKVSLTAAPIAGDELDFFVIPSANTTVTALTGVAHDSSLTGDGSSTNPLSTIVAPTTSSTGLTTWANQTTGSIVTQGTHGFTIFAPALSSLSIFSSLVRAAPAPPYTITALIAVYNQQGTNSAMQFGWASGSTNFAPVQTILWKPTYNGSDPHSVANYTDMNNHFSSAPYNSVQQYYGGQYYFQLKDDGVAISASVSPSGDSDQIITLYSVAKSSGFLGVNGYSNIVFGVIPFQGFVYAKMLSWKIS